MFEYFVLILSYIYFIYILHTHTHKHTYWQNDIFNPLTLNLPLTENLFAFFHFQINIIYYF